MRSQLLIIFIVFNKLTQLLSNCDHFDQIYSTSYIENNLLQGT